MTTQPICFIDTETDGIHHGRYAWEIAIIRRDFGPATPNDSTVVSSERVFHAFVHVPHFGLSDEFGIAKGGFWDRHPQGRELTDKAPIPGPKLLSTKAAARQVHQLLHGAHMVGINPAFDAVTFSSLLRSEGLPHQPWDYHLEDLVAETVGYLRGGRATADAISPAQWARTAPRSVTDLPWRSDELARAVGVEDLPEGERHTALGDARWARRWHDILASFAGSVALR